MSKRSFLFLAVLVVSLAKAQAQHTFDSGEGCLNVVDVGFAPEMVNRVDACASFNYRHELLLSDQFAVGGGIGCSYRKDFKLTKIPLYLSTTYFFLNKPFSPFVNLRAGCFGIVGKRNVNTGERFSISSKTAAFNLFVSPSIGVKLHLTERLGILVSASYDNYRLNAYDVGKSCYRNKMIGSLGVNVGVCFQIPKW